MLAAGCGGAPQIIDYSPEKGSTGVATRAPIRVDFDRPVDPGSVSQRFSLRPAARGRITWAGPREMLFIEQVPLRTDTTYQVLLRAGYRSQGGGAADLDHAWYFRTEGPLQVSDTSPAPAQRGVDPAGYFEVTFNHRLRATSLAGAFQLLPDAPVQATVAPSDPFRAVIAPSGLLAADTPYRLVVSSTIEDEDGNPLPKPVSLDFHTGPVRPLHGWVTCLAEAPGSDPSAGGDLWMVDQNRLPRELLAGPILAYAWAASADELTVETGDRTWEDRQLDGTSATIPIPADAVLPLGGGRGYVYLDHGTLGLLSASGPATAMATGVTQMTLSPDGEQVAYSTPAEGSTQLWVLSVELRSRYQLGAEPGAIAALAWAPDSSRLAYQVTAPGGTSIRVRVLAAAAATTIAVGPVSAPAWDADASHLYLLAAVGNPAVDRIYRVPTAAGRQTLTAGAALTAPPTLALGPPEPSPDAHQVVFVGSGVHGDELWLMNSDGTGLVRLTGGPSYSYSCRDPKWTPPA